MNRAKVLIFDDVTDLLLLSGSPHTHLHLPLLPVHVDEAIVGLGCTDKILVVAADVAGVGEGCLGQLLLDGATVTPHGRDGVTKGVHKDGAPGNSTIVYTCTVRVGDVVVRERELKRTGSR